MPMIAVVIPTRNRGANAAIAARAVLHDPADFELVVVDQSTNDDTYRALGEIDDPRLVIIRSGERGISNARNLGVAATSAPIIAFTDDDCRPCASWVSKMLSAFSEGDHIGIVFGRVTVPRGAPGDYAPSFEPRHRLQSGKPPLPDEDAGIGASFGVRRSVLNSLGGFDPLLGAGSPVFRGAEETDIQVRALSAGAVVLNAVEAEVLHLGLRSQAEARDLIVSYQRATGAAFAKHARLAGLNGLRDLSRWVMRAIQMMITSRGQQVRPGVILHFLLGAVSSVRYAIDHDAMRFRERSLRWPSPSFKR